MPNARRARLLDLLVIVGSIATGLGLLRFRLAYADIARFWATIADAPPWRWPAGLTPVRLLGLIDLMIPNLLAWTIGTVVLYFLPPREARRRLIRQPGFLACFSASGVALISYGILMATLASRGKLMLSASPQMADQQGLALEITVGLGGWGVVACWLLLKCGGHWRPRPTGMDRAGRLLGLAWVVIAAFLASFLIDILIG